MGNIATGIGLSGKLEVDNSGQLNRLAAERDAAQARQQEKARKDKERDDLEKQIAGNAVWSETMQLSRNQQTAKDVLTKRMANIFEAYQSGEGNTAIAALTELNKAKQEIESLKKFDDQQFKAFKTALEKPDEYQDFNRPVVIKGKQYNNAFEAFNDSQLAPEDIAAAYGGSEHVVVDDPYLGGKVYLPNPQPTINPIGAIRKFEDGEFSEQITGTPFKDPKLGDESYVPVSRKLNQQSIWSEIRRLGSDAGVIHYYEAQMKREMGDKGGSLKRDDAFFNEVQERIERDVYTRLNAMAVDDGRMLFTPKESEASSSSGSLFQSKKVAVFSGDDIIKAQELQPWEKTSKEGQKYQYLAVAPIQLKTSGLSMNIDIKPGTLYWDKNLNNGKGSLRAPDNYESTEKVIPHEMVFMSDGQKGQPYIRYLLAVSPPSGANDANNELFTEQASSADRFKTKAYESFYVPATEENLKRLAAVTETGIDEWNKLKVELGKRAASGRQAASSGGQGVNQGGKKESGVGTIKLQDLPVGAKIEVKNGENYYNGKKVEI